LVLAEGRTFPKKTQEKEGEKRKSNIGLCEGKVVVEDHGGCVR